MNKINIVIPMAGLGSRLKNFSGDVPKPLIIVGKKTIIEHSLETLDIEGNYIFITKKYDNEIYNKQLSKILKHFFPDCIEIITNDELSGATESVLLAQKYIDNDSPLIITNCDQHLNWDSKKFIDFIDNKDIDGAITLFESTDSKHSFAKIKENKIVLLSEKNVISNNALVGIHYWKHGKDFINSAKKLLSEYIDKGIKESYVSETYNYLVYEKNIVPYFIEENSFLSLGTPEDIKLYLKTYREYYSDKPKTIFCDIDGTIVKHLHSFSNVVLQKSNLLDNVLNKFNEWDSLGYKIILTTARKESSRKLTENQLSKLGLCWDQLIMGITSGERILINDKLSKTDSDRAKSINIITNKGFKNIKWNEYGL